LFFVQLRIASAAGIRKLARLEQSLCFICFGKYGSTDSPINLRFEWRGQTFR